MIPVFRSLADDKTFPIIGQLCFVCNEASASTRPSNKNQIQEPALPGMKVIFSAAVKIMFRSFHNTCFYRVIMDIIHFLDDKSRAIQFLRLVILSPKLVVRVSAILFTFFHAGLLRWPIRFPY